MSTTFRTATPVTIGEVITKMPKDWTVVIAYPFGGATRLIMTPNGSIWMHPTPDWTGIDYLTAPCEFEAFVPQYSTCIKIIQALANALEVRVVKALLSQSAGPQTAEAPSRGLALARKAEAWLRRNLAEPPSIARLCETLCASERTLHEAFREHLGTTPKAYLKTLRLNAARHDLLRGLGTTRVTDVALDWGFAHFGWFSQDYRRLFGETPRETLRRGREWVGRPSFCAPRVGESSPTAEAAW